MPDAPYLLHLGGIAKRFGEKIALHRVDLSVAAGEVHVVCGENGAGKTTLMNVLAGIVRPDAGEIVLRGKPVMITDPIAAARLGIGMVHQHFTLVPSMTVAENIFLGRQPRRGLVFTDRQAMRERASELVARYKFDLEIDAPVSRLSVGQRQRVEILKALAFDAEILILDEPSAVLTPPEVDALIRVIGELRARGRTIIFITHKLREVKAASDRITVMRDGKSIATHPTAEVSEADIAREMVGRDVFLVGRGEDGAPGRSFGMPLLTLDGVTVTNASARRLLDDVSFEVRAGEVLGIAGVDGNGQTELAEAVAGIAPIQAGAILLGGRDVTNSHPDERRRAGLGFVPEDRIDRGLSAIMSITENVAATNYDAAKLKRMGIVRQKAAEAFAARRIAEFDIRGATPALPVGWLSGGNMQKVVIARELEKRPRILLVSQPTRGLDVGASEFVYGQILKAADAGCAVLLVSSELSEIFALSDRIAVMYRGRIMRILDRAAANEQTIGILMNGGHEAVA